MSFHSAQREASVLMRALVLSSLGGLAWLGCSTTQLGATPDDLARGRDQTSQGAIIFSNECASCHGNRGEGLASAMAILGPGALPEYPRDSGGTGDPTITDPQLIQLQAETRPAGAAWRDPFRNAQDLYTFTKLHLPKARAAQLKDGDYWAVVSFLFAVQGASLPSGGIGSTNAASIPIPKR
jgi:mono/diheme cytochrome c family protein